MENSHETLNPDDSIDPSLNIISHSSYKSCSKSSSLPWFNIRVFYVRISNFIVDNTTPDFLTLNHIPLSPNTLLQVNGTKCSIHSQGVSCLLKRDRVDKKSEEATFVSTDSIRLTGSVKFDVFDKDDLVLSGVLELSNNNGFVSDTKNNTTRKWWMDCESVMSGGTGFFKGKHAAGSESLLPNAEVYVAGCFLGTPIILTKTLQLSFRKKHDRKATLNSIPEYEASKCQKDGSDELDFEVCLKLKFSEHILVF